MSKKSKQKRMQRQIKRLRANMKAILGAVLEHLGAHDAMIFELSGAVNGLQEQMAAKDTEWANK